MIVLSVIAVILTACGDKEAQDKIGKYIYKDVQDIYHIDSNCSSLLHQGKYKGEELYGKEMMDTSKFIIADKEFRVCANCVGDDEYDHILRISHRNENRRWLYNWFVRENYDMENFDDFIINLSDTEKRRKAYKAALDIGLDVGETFEEFSEIMGF